MPGNHKNTAANPVAAGVAGAVVGAGAAIAATKVLSDKKTRTKIINTLGNVKDEILKTVNNEEEETGKGKKISRKVNR